MPGMDLKLSKSNGTSGQNIDGLISSGLSGKLEGKSVLVTGGNAGKGRSVAILLALEGARVAIIYLDTEENDACSVKRLVEGMGGKLLLISVDSTRAIDCNAIAERSATILGEIDILYNRFALMRGEGNAWDLTEEQWKSTFRTNLSPYQHLTKSIMPHMSTSCTIITSTTFDSYLNIQSKDCQSIPIPDVFASMRMLLD